MNKDFQKTKLQLRVYCRRLLTGDGFKIVYSSDSGVHNNPVRSEPALDCSSVTEILFLVVKYA